MEDYSMVQPFFTFGTRLNLWIRQSESLYGDCGKFSLAYLSVSHFTVTRLFTVSPDCKYASN